MPLRERDASVGNRGGFKARCASSSEKGEIDAFLRTKPRTMPIGVGSACSWTCAEKPAQRPPTTSSKRITMGVVAASELSRGRRAYAENAWSQAYESLRRSDQEQPLLAQDIELLARAAYMLGRDEEYTHDLERAFHAYIDGGDVASAARCTWWIGHGYVFRGDPAPARGWFARGQRLLERTGDCVARGYLAILVVFEHSSRHDYTAAYAAADEIAEIAGRFSDPDLLTIALMEQASALLRQGQREEGLRLVDETMVAVSAGELSPMVAGIVYCNTIAFCRDLYELRAAREWTSALAKWCALQPEMLAHQGVCLVHRAELLTLAGAWPAALDEAHRAAERFGQGVLNRRALGEATIARGSCIDCSDTLQRPRNRTRRRSGVVASRSQASRCSACCRARKSPQRSRSGGLFLKRMDGLDARLSSRCRLRSSWASAVSSSGALQRGSSMSSLGTIRAKCC